jgi:hypothetical protein
MGLRQSYLKGLIDNRNNVVNTVNIYIDCIQTSTLQYI